MTGAGKDSQDSVTSLVPCQGPETPHRAAGTRHVAESLRAGALSPGCPEGSPGGASTNADAGALPPNQLHWNL